MYAGKTGDATISEKCRGKIYYKGIKIMEKILRVETGSVT